MAQNYIRKSFYLDYYTHIRDDKAHPTHRGKSTAPHVICPSKAMLPLEPTKDRTEALRPQSRSLHGGHPPGAHVRRRPYTHS